MFCRCLGSGILGIDLHLMQTAVLTVPSMRIRCCPVSMTALLHRCLHCVPEVIDTAEHDIIIVTNMA